MKISLGAVVEGGTSLNYKTGSWRDKRPEISVDVCTACGRCEMVCPDNSIQVIDEFYVVDLNYCKGCGLCAFECPVRAIEMIPEKK